MRHAGPIGAFLLAAFAVAEVASTGPARVVRDINEAAGPDTHGWPQEFVDLGDVSLFFAFTRATGFELWRTDGTGTGTSLVKDIYPGVWSSVEGRQGASVPKIVVAQLGDVAFFAAQDGVHGVELWRSDGTEDGTFLLADIHPGFGSGLVLNPSGRLVFAVARGFLFFAANDGVHGTELWRTDGTSAGTTLVRDVLGGPGSALAWWELEAAAVGDTLFFIAGGEAYGRRELWKTDGTDEGTIQLTVPPDGVGAFELAGEVRGALLFIASDTPGNLELWRSDGTEEGTFLLEDIRPGPVGSTKLIASIVTDERMYFLANDGEHGDELWSSDGTPEGTFLLSDVRPGTESSSVQLHGAHEGRVYFTADDGVHGRELWVSDGTQKGTDLVVDIVPGPSGSSQHGSFTRVGDTLYFVVNDAVHGPEVWTTDGTEGGTRQVTNLFANFGPDDLAAVGGRLFYVRGESVHGVEPWTTDGNDGGALLRDILPGSGRSYSIARPGRRGDALLFGADDGVHGAELWSTDGTPDGTRLVKNLNELHRTASSLNVIQGVELGDRLLFAASDSRHGFEPWVTDGTWEGTRMVADLVPGTSGSVSGVGLGDLGERAVFEGQVAPYGAELWVSDGTEAGTALVKDIRPGPSGSSLSQFAAIGSRVVFVADDGASGRELWVTDGTEAGTELLADVRPGPESSTIDGMARVGDLVFFKAGESTRSLWRSDGTEAGTYPVAELGPGYTATPVVFRGAVWYMTGDGSAGSELWRTDGTPAGTQRVAVMEGVVEAYHPAVAGDLLFFGGYMYETGPRLWVSDGTGPGTRRIIASEIIGFAPLIAVGDLVFFTSFDEVNDYELWRSDGTEEGTAIVKHIDPLNYGALPEHLTEVEGVLLFSAWDPEHGFEVWRSDGTEAGTFLVQDILPGPEGSTPGPFVRFGNRIAFAATGDAVGREPFAGRAAILTRQPVRAIEDLADQVRTLGLPRGDEASLTAMLDAAAAALARPGGSRVALRILDRFAREIEKTSLPIPQSAVADLLDFVREIEQLLGGDNGAAPAVPVFGAP